jgi:2-methylcitrate dehydratase PrpD
MMNDPMENLVEFIVNTRFNDLPSRVVDFAKQDFLNILGCLIIASDMEPVPKALEYVNEWGGKQESRILVHGTAVPAPLAALVMATMGRVSDLSDTDAGSIHIAEVVAPVLLSIADKQKANGKKVNGRDLITAFVVASEVVGRIGRSVFWILDRPKTQLGPTFMTFGAAAAAAKLMDFDYINTRNAMGIACSLPATPNWQARVENTTVARIGDSGLAAQNGIISVLLAQKGFTGAKNVFTGRAGLFNSLFRTRNDSTILTSNLGKKWDFLNTTLKSYMGCKVGHTSIEGLFDLIRENNINVSDIAKVNCRLDEIAVEQSAAPIESKQNPPENVVAAQASLPYMMATAAITGELFIKSFAPEVLANRDIHEFMKKVTATYDATLPHYSAVVTITLINGKEYVKRVDGDDVKGSPQKPMDWQEVDDIFRQCAARSPKAISQINLSKVIEIVRDLENCQDVTEITTLLIP